MQVVADLQVIVMQVQVAVQVAAAMDGLRAAAAPILTAQPTPAAVEAEAADNQVLVNLVLVVLAL
jgi:hypothetical protein